MTMELSMSIAIINAAEISEFFTALLLPLFVLIADVLQVRCSGRRPTEAHL
jgi:Cd2+/Zn2+-exporting ATPase/Cu+-exporting ATPase